MKTVTAREFVYLSERNQLSGTIHIGDPQNLLNYQKRGCGKCNKQDCYSLRKQTLEKAQRINKQALHTFHLADGNPFNTGTDLLEVLWTIHDDIFNHHVTKDNNDFANWVEHSLHDKELANSLRKCNNRAEMIRLLR